MFLDGSIYLDGTNLPDYPSVEFYSFVEQKTWSI